MSLFFNLFHKLASNAWVLTPCNFCQLENAPIPFEHSDRRNGCVPKNGTESCGAFSGNKKRGAPAKMTNAPNFSGLSPASFDSLLLFLRVQIQDPIDIILRRLVVLYLLSRLAILSIQSLFQRQQLAIFCIQLLHIWNLIHLLEGILGAPSGNKSFLRGNLTNPL